MDAASRLFGSELSPYSVKVRSYLRYKGIAHEWILRNPANAAEFQKHAKLPLIPLLVTPSGEAMQDSTPIIERLEALHPDPALQPADPALAFLSALFEEYGDEWLNKPMFHYRWFYPENARSAAERIAAQMFPGAPADQLAKGVAAVEARMVPRLSFVGSTPQSAPTIEASLRRALGILEGHLLLRPYLFGGRPALADFGLWGQLYECSTDPTPAAIVARHPAVRRWIERMLEPKAEGPFESWDALAPGLLRLLKDEVGAVFLPWSTANAEALAAGAKTFEVELGGTVFSQEPQKYHARSLAEIRAKHAAVKADPRLERILRETGCLPYLAA